MTTDGFFYALPPLDRDIALLLRVYAAAFKGNPMMSRTWRRNLGRLVESGFVSRIERHPFGAGLRLICFTACATEIIREHAPRRRRRSWWRLR